MALQLIVITSFCLLLPTPTWCLSTKTAIIHRQLSSSTALHHHNVADKALDPSKTVVPPNDAVIIKVPWLIVGGGIHGVHVAIRLLEQEHNKDSAQYSRSDSPHCIIVDPHEKLLDAWKSRTNATGMKYLRSSCSFNLDTDESALLKFARKSIRGDHGSGNKKRRKHASRRHERQYKKNNPVFAPDYDRPRLDLFNQHCDSVILKWHLDKLHVQGSVTSVDAHYFHDGVLVCASPTANDMLTPRQIYYKAQNVVLAVGSGRPLFPDWVTQEAQTRGLVQHLLDDNVDIEKYVSDKNEPETDCNKSKIVIVGSGISAGHKALQVVEEQEQTSQQYPEIHLISRHSNLRQQQFDTHQDWMMDQAAAWRSRQGGGSGLPKRQVEFAKTTSLQERRSIIARERIPGTMTRPIHDGLQRAIANGKIQWHACTEIAHVDMSNSCDSCEVTLSNGTVFKNVKKIWLATGFERGLPCLEFLADDLPVSPYCGFPIVNEHLQWHPRIFVTGALAELELGPSARNIAGARLAAERIVNTSAGI